MKTMPATILVTNDDGIHSSGIIALAKAVRGLGEVWIVAPDRERSAIGHALTLHRPLFAEEIRERVYRVNGTPTDCVVLAVNRILPSRRSIILSGINRGGNLGDDITYSGTVSAALEGTLMGIVSVAFSLEGVRPFHFTTAGKYAAYVTEKVLREGLPADTLLNVNIPNLPRNEIKGLRITGQGKRTYDNAIREVKDPWGRRHYWLGGGTPVVGAGTDTDTMAGGEGCVSVTPLHLDLTDYHAMGILGRDWGADDTVF